MNNNNKNKRLRILFVEQNQDGTVGGSHQSLLLLVKSLDKSKYEPIVLFYEDYDIIEKFKPYCNPHIYHKPMGKKFSLNIIGFSIPIRISQKAFNFFFTSIIPLFRFLFFIIKHRINLIHLNNSVRTGWEWLLAAKILRRKCVTHQRGFWQLRPFARLVASRFDKIICISDAVEIFLKQCGLSENLITIYNTIDCDAFCGQISHDKSTIRQTFDIDQNAPLIGVVGNFQRWKGQYVVVKAVDIIRHQHPNVVCMLIGDVSRQYPQDSLYYAELKNLIKNLGIEHYFVFTGYRQDIPDIINALDVLIHSSTTPEPFGRVLIEGMCMEKPVIATAIGGPLEIIEHKINGLLIPPDSPQVLANAVSSLLRDREFSTKMGIRARQRVVSKYDFPTFADSINNLYDSILS